MAIRLGSVSTHHSLRGREASQTKQSNIHDPSSPLEAGLGIASGGFSMARWYLAVYDSYLRWIWLGRWVLPLRGRVTIKPFVRRNSKKILWWLSTYYPCCGCCG